MEVPLFDPYTPPGMVDLTLLPGAAKSIGGLPKLEKEEKAPLLSIEEMVKILAPFTLPGE
jgi:hypothetical protein